MSHASLSSQCIFNSQEIQNARYCFCLVKGNFSLLSKRSWEFSHLTVFC